MATTYTQNPAEVIMENFRREMEFHTTKVQSPEQVKEYYKLKKEEISIKSMEEDLRAKRRANKLKEDREETKNRNDEILTYLKMVSLTLGIIGTGVTIYKSVTK